MPLHSLTLIPKRDVKKESGSYMMLRQLIVTLTRRWCHGLGGRHRKERWCGEFQGAGETYKDDGKDGEYKNDSTLTCSRLSLESSLTSFIYIGLLLLHV
jgi:hypothetical protein